MGCDIHMYTEVKRSIREKEVWVNVDDFRINPYYDGKDNSERQFEHQDLYGDRNYGLFTLLAGVRDYSEKTIPVSDPKGLPENMSDITREESERWDGDGHTHSWLTLAELKSFQAKNPSITRSGLINQRQVAELESGIFPNTWCQGTNQEGYIRKEWVEPSTTLVPLIEKITERMKDVFWIYNDDYDKSIEEKIRIVFWFDN